MAPLKSILRSSSFMSRNRSKTPSFDFDKADDDESQQATLPPRLRKKEKASKSKRAKPVHAPQDEARFDEEPRVGREKVSAWEPRDVPQIPSSAHDDKINRIIDIDAFSIIESFVSMIASFEEEKEYNFEVADEESVQGDGLEITLENFLEYEMLRPDRLFIKGVTEEEGSEEATCGESVASEEKLLGENIALEPPEEPKRVAESTIEAPKLVAESTIEAPKLVAEAANEAPPPQKVDKRNPFEIAEDNLIEQLWMPQLERIRAMRDVHKAELQRVKEQVEQLKAAMAQRKMQRLLIERTVAERMRKNFKVLEESMEAQKKIEAEYERILKKRQTPPRPQSISVPQMSEDDDVDFPPPVENGFKLEQYADYEVHFADVPVLPENEDDDEQNAVHQEKKLNAWSATVLEATKNAWGDLLDLAEDLVTSVFTKGGCSPDSLSASSAGIPEDIEYDISIAEEPETEVAETKQALAPDERHAYVIVDSGRKKETFA